MIVRRAENEVDSQRAVSYQSGELSLIHILIRFFSGYEGPPLPPEDAFDAVLEGDELGTARFYSSLPELGWPDVGFRVVLDAEDLRRVIGGEIRR